MKGNDEEDLRLFVTGMMATCTALELGHYFEWFGEIEDVREIKLEISSSKSFIVVPANQKIFSDILEYVQREDLTFQGRQLHCQPFASGEKLKNLNQQLSSRRVLLKRVPSYITPFLLKQELEMAVGKISRIFAYQSDVPKRSTQSGGLHQKKFQTYSIIFEEQKAADTLVRFNSYWLQGYPDPIIVEKYDFKVVRRKSKVRGAIRGNKGSGRGGTSSSVTRSDGKRFENWKESIETGYKKPTKPHDKSEPRKKKPIKVASEDKLKHLKIDINDRAHFLKPTSSKYFRAISKFNKQPESNLQLRILVPKLQRLPHC